MSSIPQGWNPDCRSDTSVVVKQHTRKPGEELFKPFLFMVIPPEIRNCVYSNTSYEVENLNRVSRTQRS